MQINFGNVEYFLLILVCIVLNMTRESEGWLRHRQPRFFGKHLPKKMLLTQSKRVQNKIATIHNFFRGQVKPRASNMLEMSWHQESSKRAQAWADECHMLKHDNATDRMMPLYGHCGQNIFVSTHKVPWMFAIKTWFLEHHNFTYGSSKNDLGVIGHYTQMVWATSHKLGCGFASCRTRHGRRFFNYVCNYCPTGNYIGIIGKPYKKGSPCSSCPHHCNIKNKLCTNSCIFSDRWVNCKELKKQWPHWLCRDKSKEGRKRRKHCRATCHCRNKITQDFSDY